MPSAAASHARSRSRQQGVHVVSFHVQPNRNGDSVVDDSGAQTYHAQASPMFRMFARLQVQAPVVCKTREHRVPRVRRRSSTATPAARCARVCLRW